MKGKVEAEKAAMLAEMEEVRGGVRVRDLKRLCQSWLAFLMRGEALEITKMAWLTFRVWA